MATDLYLDPVTNDIELVPDTGQLRLISGVDLVAQRIRLRIKTHLGEWPLDITAGLNWKDVIFVKNPNLAQVSADIRSIILDTPGVDRFAEDGFLLSLDRVSRELTVDYTVFVDDETLSQVEVF